MDTENTQEINKPSDFHFKAHQAVYLGLKRLIDIFGSLLGIVLLSPLLLFATIGTKLSSKGPVFFRQRRMGKNEKIFTILKFRSMYADSPNVAPADLSVEEQQALITKWGRFIRRTSIDEIPQLFNVFVGQMSFIGPRPQQSKELERKLYDDRKACVPDAFLVKPGMCSLAIVMNNRSHDTKSKAYWDSKYVKEISLWMDAKVFFTAFGILLGLHKIDQGR